MTKVPVSKMFDRLPEVDFDGTHPADLERNGSAPKSDVEIQAELSARLYNRAKRLPKPDVIFSIAGTPVSTPGNLTTIYSQAKTGKSSLVGAMLAATMTTPTSGHDCLGVAGPNYGKKAVLHFDTEQAPFDWQTMIDVALKRVKLTDPPPWLLSYTLTGMPAREVVNLVRAAMRLGGMTHGGIHSIIIDGIADMVIDPNDAEECFPLITELLALAIQHHCPIINILHMNPGSDVKGRGHLGSQLERKSESNITLEKTEETTLVYATKQRGKMITKDRAVAFAWSDDLGMHVTTENTASRRTGRAPKYEFESIRPIMPLCTERPATLGQLLKQATDLIEIPRNSLRDLLAREVEVGRVERVFDRMMGPAFRMAQPPVAKDNQLV